MCLPLNVLSSLHVWVAWTKPSCSAQEEQRFAETLVHACSSSPAIPALSPTFHLLLALYSPQHDPLLEVMAMGWHCRHLQPESLSVRELSLTPPGSLVTPKCWQTGVTTSSERAPFPYFFKVGTTPWRFVSGFLSGFCFGMILFYSPGWPWFRGLPASASWLLWLQECSVASGEFCEFWNTLSWAHPAQLMASVSKCAVCFHCIIIIIITICIVQKRLKPGPCMPMLWKNAYLLL